MKTKFQISSKVKPLLEEAERYFGKKVEFKDRSLDSQADYRANDFSDPENGIIYYDPSTNYNSIDGQKKIAHELIHIIYFHKEKVLHPTPWEGLDAESKFLAERMAEFVEDLFVLRDLESLGFGKDGRYKERIEKIAKYIAKGYSPASLKFPRVPDSQQELMAKQFAVICLMDKDLMTEKNFSILKLVTEAKFGPNSMKLFQDTANGLINISNLNENLKNKVQKAQKYAFTKFGVRKLVKLSAS